MSDFKGIFLYIVGVLFNVKWCIRVDLVFFCHILNATIIAHDQYTDIHPLLNVYIYLYLLQMEPARARNRSRDLTETETESDSATHLVAEEVLRQAKAKTKKGKAKAKVPNMFSPKVGVVGGGGPHHEKPPKVCLELWISLYAAMVITSPIEWCITEPLSSSIVSYKITSI